MVWYVFRVIKINEKALFFLMLLLLRDMCRDVMVFWTLYPVSYVEMLGKKRRFFFSFLMERNARWDRWDARNTGIFIRFLKLCEQWGLLIDVLGMPMRVPGDFDEKLQWWETAEMMGVSQNNEANESIGFPLKMHDVTIWEYGVT